MTDIVERLQDPEQYVDRDGPVPWPSVVDDAVTEIKEYRRVAKRVSEILIGDIGARGPEKLEMTATRAAARLRLYEQALGAIAKMGRENAWGVSEARDMAREVLGGGIDLLYEWDRLGEGEPVVPRPVQPPSRPQPARKGFETIDDETVLLGSLSLVRLCRRCGTLVGAGHSLCGYCSENRVVDLSPRSRCRY